MVGILFFYIQFLHDYMEPDPYPVELDPDPGGPKTPTGTLSD